MATVTSATKFFSQPKEGFITTVGVTFSGGASSVTFNSLTGYNDGDLVVLVLDPSTPASKDVVVGTKAGNTLTGCIWTEGPATGHNAGVTVVDYVSATHWALITKGLLVQHNIDGTHSNITATSITATGAINASAVGQLQDASTALSTIRTETQFDFVASGGVWSGLGYGTTLTATMTALVAYINGRRIAISAIATRTFTASKDTYIDVLDNLNGTGTIVYTEVANNATSPALAANSLRIGIIVTGANIAAATSVNQGQESMVVPLVASVPLSVADALGNLICPRDPNRKILGYRQITVSFTTTNNNLSTTIPALSMPIIVPTGRKIKLSAFTSSQSHSAGNAVVLELWDGVVGSGTLVQSFITTSSSPFGSFPSQPITPATSSKTYALGVRGTNAGTTTVSAATTTPAYILAELD